MSTSKVGAEAPCYALLDFVGDRVEPNEIAPLLSLKLGKAKRKGETTVGPDRLRPGQKPPVARTGYCHFSTRWIESSADINDHISVLLEAVRARATEIKQLLRDRGLIYKIVCFFDDDEYKKTWVLSEKNRQMARELAIDISNETVTETTTFVFGDIDAYFRDQRRR